MGSLGGYAPYYAPKEAELVKQVEKIVEITKVIAVPFEVHGCSKLTADPDGRQIWLNLCAFVNQLANKVVQHKPGTGTPYQITETGFFVPEGDVEALVHDMCHWIVASPVDRKKVNLGMDDTSDETWLIRQEENAWSLESWIFSAVLGESDLVDYVSPHAEMETTHYWVRVFDPIDTALFVLKEARDVKLNVTLLRRLLATWVQWREANPAADARPRGCLGWGTIGLPLPIAGAIKDTIEPGYGNPLNSEVQAKVGAWRKANPPAQDDEG